MHEHRIVYEEVPGSRTTQDAVIQPQRERIAYEELQPSDIIQDGDEWRNEDGRWQPFTSLTGSRVQVRHSQRARRPHSITMMLREFANQAEVLAEVRADEKRLFDDVELLRSEYAKLQGERDEACRERDLARSEVARLSTELWARKPMEDRVASLTEELTQAREASQQLLQTIADNAAHFADHTKVLEQERDDLQTALIESRLEQQRKVAEAMEVCKERDEVEAELKRVQEVVCNLYNEPTARQVQDMLRTWATELDWSAGCFDSVGREQIDTIQRTLIAVIERIETMINPEGTTDGN